MTRPAIRAAATAAYLPHVLAEVPRLLSQIDREPSSPGAGSFDRDWWAWKFRDCPITMLQAGLLPLATLWAQPFPESPYFRNAQLAEWIQRGVEHSVVRQRPNGAFDSVGPNTQDHGVTLAMAYILCKCLSQTGEAWPDALRARCLETVREAARFAERSAEDYAFVSNHHALFALAWLEAETAIGERGFRAHADEEVASILSHQSPDGWYAEYGGADPGYESLGIHYLTKVWERTGNDALLTSLRKSVEFFAHAVHPDGSVGGAYGSRGTALFMPAGFEQLAPHDATAAAIALYLRPRLGDGNVVTPHNADPMNLPILMTSYLEACLGSDTAPAAGGRLPFEEAGGIRAFAASGLVTAATPRYYAVFSASRGGVIRVFDRVSGQLAYQDAGYVATSNDSGRWTSQGATGTMSAGDHEATADSRFSASRPLLPTPWTFLLLRSLQLTLFRSRRIGAWIRRRIVNRLITGRQDAPLSLMRRIRFLDDRIEVHDCVTRSAAATVREVTIAASLTPIHMGSARYFTAPSCSTCLARLRRHWPTRSISMDAQSERSRSSLRMARRHAWNDVPAPTEAVPNQASSTLLIVLMGMAAVHAAASWDHAVGFSGDYARWLGEIERYGRGEMPYRDFVWNFPPLTMWTLGTYARLFGSGVTAISIATSTIFLAIAALYGLYVGRLIDRSLALLTAVPAFILAMAYASSVGAPLPLGMYVPAVPIGFLCLLSATLIALNSIAQPTRVRAAALGFAAGLGVLAKQDFWLPSLYLVAVFAILVWRRREADRTRLAGMAIGSMLLTIATGAAIVLAQTNLSTLLALPSGFGLVAEFGGRGVPSWERLTVEVVDVAALVALVAACGAIARVARPARAWLVTLGALTIAAAGSAIYLVIGIRTATTVVSSSSPLAPMAAFVAQLVAEGRPVGATLARFLADRLLIQLFPAILPVFVLALVVRRRGDLRTRSSFQTVVLLLGLCVTARLRRLFQEVDWQHFLLELPVYVLALQSLMSGHAQRVTRALTVALLSLTVVACGTYWYFARGPLTRTTDWVRVDTPHGGIYLQPNQASLYQELRTLMARIDPPGARPLFAFGYSSAFNYFLDRPNASPLMQGFRLSNFDPSAAVQALLVHDPPVLLLDVLNFRSPVPRMNPSVTSWEMPMVQNHYVRFDRMYFNQVLSHCTTAGQVPSTGRAVFRLYSCGQ